MSQNLLTVTIADFARQLPLVSFPYLKDMIGGIDEFKRDNYTKDKDVNNPIVMDVERKETKIWNEMQRRGYNISSPEFINWIKELQNKRTKIIVGGGK